MPNGTKAQGAAKKNAIVLPTVIHDFVFRPCFLRAQN
jgi:hypothetical protein